MKCNICMLCAFVYVVVVRAIVGFREHIFTGGVSSLANYMALQELSFVTLGHRVLHTPLRMRLHYGHPDVFDKLYVMSCGGVSKVRRMCCMHICVCVCVCLCVCVCMRICLYICVCYSCFVLLYICNFF